MRNADKEDWQKDCINDLVIKSKQQTIRIPEYGMMDNYLCQTVLFLYIGLLAFMFMMTNIQ